MAHRVAPCFCFCFCLFPTASAPQPSWGELSAHCALMPSVYFGGRPDSDLSAGMYGENWGSIGWVN